MANKAKNSHTHDVQKHETEANWRKAVNFTPKLGQLIIYDADEKHPFARIKVGDGVHNVNDLPFISTYQQPVQTLEWKSFDE